MDAPQEGMCCGEPFSFLLFILCILTIVIIIRLGTIIEKLGTIIDVKKKKRFQSF